MGSLIEIVPEINSKYRDRNQERRFANTPMPKTIYRNWFYISPPDSYANLMDIMTFMFTFFKR